MATERRAPEDLQEAVAATLRRLRGELGTPGQAPAARQEPALGPTLAGPAAPVAAAASVAPPPPAQPDLLSRAEPEHEIPPNPSARLAELRQAMAKPDPAERRRPRLLPYMLSILAVAVFAGIGWWAYKSISGTLPNGEVPVVAASPTPDKVPPPSDQAASTSTTNSNQTIYNAVSPGSAPEPKTEVLLAPPPTPQLPAPTGTTTTAATTATDTGSTTGTGTTSATTGSASAGTSAGASTAATTASGTTGSTPVVPATVPSTTTAAKVPAASLANATTTGGSSGMTETLIPGMSTSSAAAASPSTGVAQSATMPAASGTDISAQTPAQSASESGTGTATVPAEPLTVQGTQTATTTSKNNATASAAAVAASASPAATAPASPTTTEMASLGNYRIQLASLKSEEAAQTTWKRLESKYKSVLADLTLHIEKVALTSGIYYRVQAGPFRDKVAAYAACGKLQTQGQQCIVKR